MTIIKSLKADISSVSLSSEGWDDAQNISFELYSGQFTSSSQLIILNYPVILSHQYHSFFRNLPPLFICFLHCMTYGVKISLLYIFEDVLSMTSILATTIKSLQIHFSNIISFSTDGFFMKCRELRALFSECILDQLFILLPATSNCYL